MDSPTRKLCSYSMQQTRKQARVELELPRSEPVHTAQVRGRLSELVRGGEAARCAIRSSRHNHDCAPNARSVIEADGSVQIQSLKEIKDGEEVTISYVDPKLPYEERRKTLLKHYGFECRCARCLNEQRSELKTKMKQRDQYLQAQRR